MKTRPGWLWCAAIVEIAALAGVAVVALDLYAHKKLDAVAGLNVWGYRGAVAHQKQPREIRLAVIGGTRAFGLGMPASWTIATVLRQQVMLVVDRRGGEVRQVVPLTLARPGALPDSYEDTLRHFAYLTPDYICVFDDLGVGGAPLREETSGVFAHTGYWPALPLALREKGMAWRYGSVRAGYVGVSTEVTPAWPRRAAGLVLEALGGGLARADARFARPAAPHGAGTPDVYAREMLRDLDFALTQARGVVVALAPAESGRQSANRAALLPRLEARAASTPRLRVVDLADEPLLRDPVQRLDGWNYGGDAVAAAATAITPAVLDLIRRFEPRQDAAR